MLTIREHRFPFWKRLGIGTVSTPTVAGHLLKNAAIFRFDAFNSEIRSCSRHGVGWASRKPFNETYDGQVPDIWDHGYVIVDFASGARAMLELCMFAEGAEFQEHIIATGPDGIIESLVPGPERFWPTETLGPSPTPKLIVSPRNPKGPIEKEIPVDPTILAAGITMDQPFINIRNSLIWCAMVGSQKFH